MVFKCDKMSLSTALTVKIMLVFLEYIFQFFINKALPASNSVDRQNFTGKSVKDDLFNEANQYYLSWHNRQHVDLTRRRSGIRLSPLETFLFFFVKPHFHFWTDLNIPVD